MYFHSIFIHQATSLFQKKTLKRRDSDETFIKNVIDSMEKVRETTGSKETAFVDKKVCNVIQFKYKVDTCIMSTALSVSRNIVQCEIVYN